MNTSPLISYWSERDFNKDKFSYNSKSNNYGLNKGKEGKLIFIPISTSNIILVTSNHRKRNRVKYILMKVNNTNILPFKDEDHLAYEASVIRKFKHNDPSYKVDQYDKKIIDKFLSLDLVDQEKYYKELLTYR